MGVDFPDGNPWREDRPPKRKKPEPPVEEEDEPETDVFRDPPRRRFG